MERLKILTTMVAVTYSIAFLDGVFYWNLADGFYILLGIIIAGCIIWMLRIVYKK